jgi:hypothetical protein
MRSPRDGIERRQRRHIMRSEPCQLILAGPHCGDSGGAGARASAASGALQFPLRLCRADDIAFSVDWQVRHAFAAISFAAASFSSSVCRALACARLSGAPSVIKVDNDKIAEQKVLLTAKRKRMQSFDEVSLCRKPICIAPSRPEEFRYAHNLDQPMQ